MSLAGFLNLIYVCGGECGVEMTGWNCGERLRSVCSRRLIGILALSFRLGFIKVAIQHGYVSANL